MFILYVFRCPDHLQLEAKKGLMHWINYSLALPEHRFGKNLPNRKVRIPQNHLKKTSASGSNKKKKNFNIMRVSRSKWKTQKKKKKKKMSLEKINLTFLTPRVL